MIYIYLSIYMYTYTYIYIYNYLYNDIYISTHDSLSWYRCNMFPPIWVATQDTKASIGPPLWCTAFRRCTSSPLAIGVAWMDPWIPMRAVPTSWPMTGVSVRDPASSPEVDGTRPTPWSSATTSNWWNVSTPADNLPALRSVAMCQVGCRTAPPLNMRRGFFSELSQEPFFCLQKVERVIDFSFEL